MEREYDNGGEEGSGRGNSNSMRVELNRLRKENKRLRMEREILKKRQPSSRKNQDENFASLIQGRRHILYICYAKSCVSTAVAITASVKEACQPEIGNGSN
jgi:hypothetical protein